MSDCTWIYDVATQSIAGAISGGVVGWILLRSQHRMEKRMEEARRRIDSQYELLGAALRMYQIVSQTFARTGDRNFVAGGWEQGHRARAEWAAVEAVRHFTDDVLNASRTAREELELDLHAILAMSPAGDGEPGKENRVRWSAIGKRQGFEPLQALIAACRNHHSWKGPAPKEPQDKASSTTEQKAPTPSAEPPAPANPK
jgi:hypothetical protein